MKIRHTHKGESYRWTPYLLSLIKKHTSCAHIHTRQSFGLYHRSIHYVYVILDTPGPGSYELKMYSPYLEVKTQASKRSSSLRSQ